MLDVIEKLKKTNYSLAKDNAQHKRVIGEMQSKNLDLARKNYELVVQVTQLMVANRAHQLPGKEQPKGVAAVPDRPELQKGRLLGKKPMLVMHKVPQVPATTARDPIQQAKAPTNNVTTRALKKQPLSLNSTSRTQQVRRNDADSKRMTSHFFFFVLKLTKEIAISRPSLASTLPPRCQFSFQ